MKIRITTLTLMLLLLNSQAGYAEENEYGVVKAWFDGKNATIETIEGIKLKVGEPIEVKVEVISKIDGNVYVEITEPGITKAFSVLSGPSKQDETIDNYNIKSGWSEIYTWTIAPNGAWKNGNAPINIFVSFSKKGNQKPIQFTIANPFILDEQYPGSSPAKTTGIAQPSPTGTSSEPKPSPFLPAAGALAVVIGVWMLKRRRAY